MKEELVKMEAFLVENEEMKREEGRTPFIVGMKCEGDVNRIWRGVFVKVGRHGAPLS